MGLWKDKKRKDWRYSFQFRGKTFAGGGHRTKAVARAAREMRREIVKANTYKQTPRNMAFRELASIYLDDAERRFAKKTYEYKAYVFRCFLSIVGNMIIADITPQIIHHYLNTRPSNNNYNAHRKDLCALFNFAVKRLRITNFNPCSEISKVPHTPKRKVIPTERQIQNLIQVSNPETERPLILLILFTTARVDEILRLKWEDIDLKNNKLVRWTRKRSGGVYEPIVTPINNDLMSLLKSLYEIRSNDEWVIYNRRTKTRFHRRPKLMKSICNRAGIDENFGFHSLRHFAASFIASKEGISKKSISNLLGHKSLSTTEIYLHSIDYSDKIAINAIDGVFDF